MSRGATLALKITGDASGGLRALDDMERKAGGIGGALGKMGGVAAAGAAVGIAALVDFGKASYDAASDLQQSTGAIDSVFGDWALDIEQSAQKADEAVGLSTSAYEQMAAVLGAQLKGMGQDVGDATANTQALIEKGADLSATFGGTSAEAVEALSSALKGEFDPLERYGVSLKQSTINAELAAKGQDKLTGAALQQAQAAAVLDLINRKTADSQGAFARESDTAAGATQRFSAWLENVQAAAGQKLLPIVMKVANWLRTSLGPIFTQVTAAGGPLSKLFAYWGDLLNNFLIPAFKGIWAFLSTYIIPIFKAWLLPAIDGVRAAFKAVGDKIGENKGRFEGLYQSIKPFLEFLRDKVAPVVGTLLKGAFEVLGAAIGIVVDAIGWVVDKVKWLIDKGSQVANFIGGLFGAPAGGGHGSASRGAVRGAARGGLFGAASSLTGGGAGPSAAGVGLAPATVINVTVNGALDPDAVADQIDRLLSRRARLTGSRVAVAL